MTNDMYFRLLSLKTNGTYPTFQSLAEAALALNGVFEAADAACRQYMENVQRRVDVAMLQNEEKCRRMQEESARKWGLGPSDTESAAASRQE